MAKDLWLPKGYELPDGSRVRSLLYSGDEWQIFDTNGSNNILLARPELTQKWNELGFLDESLFEDVAHGGESFRSMSSHKKYALTPVENGKSPESKVDAMAFAFALKESRKLSEDASFHDAVYVEQYSRLLPGWTLTPHVDDEVVLGTWITGGVVISTESFRRLTNLTGWMPAGDLAEIINAAGFLYLQTQGCWPSASRLLDPGAMQRPPLRRRLSKLKNRCLLGIRPNPRYSDFQGDLTSRNFLTNTLSTSSLMRRNIRLWALISLRPSSCMDPRDVARPSPWSGLSNSSIGLVTR
jgi:hypothetical protein